MGTDQFDDVSRVVSGSLPARALRHTAVGFRAAAPRSHAGVALARARAGLSAIPPTERIRLAGVLLLTAAMTHSVLLRFVPEIVRPAAPWLLSVATGLIALALILTATALERAWRTSGVRAKFLSQSVR